MSRGSTPVARAARRAGLAVAPLAVAPLAVAVVAGVAPLPAARAAGAQGSGAGVDAPRPTPLPIDRVALLRCVAAAPLPCVRVRLTLPPSAAATPPAAAAPMLDASAAGWDGRAGPYPLQLVSARASRAGGPPRAVLVLVDASGSMAGGGVQVARAAVRSFVRELGEGADDGRVGVAVAPFASRGVATGVRGARFTAPAQAAGAVDRLAAPAGNTGLYTAVAVAAERVAEARRALGAGAVGAVVVVTDGRNDVRDPAGRVRPGDDGDLLDGAAGQAAAAAALARAGVPLFAIGVGPEPDTTELRALAGPRGFVARTALDAVALREALGHVDVALTTARELVFAVPGAERVGLARAGWPVRLAWRPDAAGAEAVRFEGAWPAPLLAAPAFDGAVYGRPADAPAWLRAAAEERPVPGRPALLALFLAATTGALWWLPRARGAAGPPRAAGRGVGPAEGGAARPTAPHPAGTARGAPGVAAPGVAAPARGAVAAGQLRPDVRDAPPRRPHEVTAPYPVLADAGAPPARERAAPRPRSFAVQSAADPRARARPSAHRPPSDPDPE